MIPVNLISSCSPDRVVSAILQRRVGSEGELGSRAKWCLPASAASGEWPLVASVSPLRGGAPATSPLRAEAPPEQDPGSSCSNEEEGERRRSPFLCGPALRCGAGVLVGAALGGGVSTALPRSQREQLCLEGEGLGKGKNLLWAGENPRGLGDLSRAFSAATREPGPGWGGMKITSVLVFLYRCLLRMALLGFLAF